MLGTQPEIANLLKPLEEPQLSSLTELYIPNSEYYAWMEAHDNITLFCCEIEYNNDYCNTTDCQTRTICFHLSNSWSYCCNQYVCPTLWLHSQCHSCLHWHNLSPAHNAHCFFVTIAHKCVSNIYLTAIASNVSGSRIQGLLYIYIVFSMYMRRLCTFWLI